MPRSVPEAPRDDKSDFALGPAIIREGVWFTGVAEGRRAQTNMRGRNAEMVARLWHGWTSRENGEAYEDLLRSEVLPGIHRVEGYRGAYLLRRDAGKEVEFVTLALFENLEAVVAFAGVKFENAVVPPAARKLLSRYDVKSVHYETLLTPDH